MAAILSGYMRVRRAVRRRPQNIENDVSIYVPGSEQALGTRFDWSIDRFDFQ